MQLIKHEDNKVVTVSSMQKKNKLTSVDCNDSISSYVYAP